MPCDRIGDAHDVMVLHVLADAGQRVHDRHADLREMLGIADSGQLQQMRRADRAGRQDYLARRPRPARPGRRARTRPRPRACRRTRCGAPAPLSRAAGWAASAPGADRCAPCWRGGGRRGSAGTSRCSRRRRARSLTSSRYSSPICLPASITVGADRRRSISEVNSGPSLPRTSLALAPSARPFLK